MCSVSPESFPVHATSKPLFLFLDYVLRSCGYSAAEDAQIRSHGRQHSADNQTKKSHTTHETFSVRVNQLRSGDQKENHRRHHSHGQIRNILQDKLQDHLLS